MSLDCQHDAVHVSEAGHIRALRQADVPRLTGINPTFASLCTLALDKRFAGLASISWALEYQPLDTPFERRDRYDLRPEELAEIAERLRAGNSLQLAAEDEDCISALPKVEPSPWRAVGHAWNVHKELSVAGRGETDDSSTVQMRGRIHEG